MMETPETKEIRAFNFEVRAENDEQRGNYIEGRAIVFETRQDMGWYDEIIADGALDKCDMKDIRLLINHNTDMIPLARSRNNNENSTMQLSVVPGGGLDFRANLDTENNTDASALYSAAGRGDLSGCSFMFTVPKGGDKWDDVKSDHPTRTITNISKIFEVSCCTFPAYEATSLEARGLSHALESAKESLESVRAEVRALELAKAKLKLKARF